jgi:hypothetical protein
VKRGLSTLLSRINGVNTKLRNTACFPQLVGLAVSTGYGFVCCSAAAHNVTCICSHIYVYFRVIKIKLYTVKRELQCGVFLIL